MAFLCLDSLPDLQGPSSLSGLGAWSQRVCCRQGDSPHWRPTSPISSSSHSRPPELEPAFPPTRCPRTPTLAGLASVTALAVGQKHRVTFRPLLSWFSGIWGHPNSTNYSTFYQILLPSPHTFMSLLQEVSPTTPAHISCELSSLLN